jgi:hypothetical protein
MDIERRQILQLAAGATFLPVVSPVAVLGQSANVPTNPIMIVERTHYFAKPGLADEVRGTTHGFRRARFDRPSSRRNIR